MHRIVLSEPPMHASLCFHKAGSKLLTISLHVVRCIYIRVKRLTKVEGHLTIAKNEENAQVSDNDVLVVDLAKTTPGS